MVVELDGRIPMALTVPPDVLPAAEETDACCPTLTDRMSSSPIDSDSVTPVPPMRSTESLVLASSPTVKGTALTVPEMGAVMVALDSAS